MKINIEHLAIEIPFRNRAHAKALTAEIVRRLERMPPLALAADSARSESLRADLPRLPPGASDVVVAEAVATSIHRALAQAIGSVASGASPRGPGAPMSPGVSERGPGAPLPQATRARYERGLGEDFSSVRVHSDARAGAVTESFDADAVTVGDEIFLRPGHLRTDTAEGNELLAHELTHVAQQRRGGAPASRPALEAEADVTAATIASGGSARARQSAAPGLPLARRRKDKETDSAHPKTVAPLPPVSSRFPGFSQGDYATCGAASVVSALMIWDNAQRDPAAPNHLLVTACNVLLVRLIRDSDRLIPAWDKMDLKGGLTGKQRWQDIFDTITQVRDKARIPGSKIAQDDYQQLGAAIYMLYHAHKDAGLSPSETKQMIGEMGLGGGREAGAPSLQPLFGHPVLAGLKPAQAAQITWYTSSDPNPDGDRSITQHAFVIGRFKGGEWFLSDQGSTPALELSAPTLEELQQQLRAAQISRRSHILLEGTVRTREGLLPATVRLLGDPAAIDQMAIASVLKPGDFLAEVDAPGFLDIGFLNIGDKITAGAFVARTDDLQSALAALPPGAHGGVVVEFPEDVFNLYKTSTVSKSNLKEKGIDVAGSTDGRLRPSPPHYFHAWLILSDAQGNRSPPFQVY